METFICSRMRLRHLKGNAKGRVNIKPLEVPLDMGRKTGVPPAFVHQPLPRPRLTQWRASTTQRTSCGGKLLSVQICLYDLHLLWPAACNRGTQNCWDALSGKWRVGLPAQGKKTSLGNISWGEGSRAARSNTFNIGSGFPRWFIAGAFHLSLRITLRKEKTLLQLQSASELLLLRFC